MCIWLLMLADVWSPPTRFDPVTWHTHELLFGYVSVVIAGFLLTAVPNWTGCPPVRGWPLVALVALWLLGRLAVAVSAALPAWAVLPADVSFLTVLWLTVLRDVVATRHRNAIPVLVMVAGLIASNAMFHLEAAGGAYAARGLSLRLGLSVVLLLVAVIGGRIIPTFTRNWLVARGAAVLPAPPMQALDKAVLAGTAAVFLWWSFVSEGHLTAALLICVALAHLIRMSRWCGVQTGPEPLIWVLHLAYAFVPLGALVTALAQLLPQMVTQASGIHLWTAGAVSLMTIGVMTRATLGHTGRALHADRHTTLVYLALLLCVVFRVAADIAPEIRGALLNASAGL